MRKVTVTKQDIIKPKAVFYGLSIRQIVIMAIGMAVGIGVFSLLYFILEISIDVALIPVFIILVIFASGSVAQINGTSALYWIITILKGNITRPYKSEGAFDNYEEKQ